MSHEGMRGEGNETDKKNLYNNEARKQLYNEGKLGLWGTTDEFWEQQRKINSRANELEEKDNIKY